MSYTFDIIDIVPVLSFFDYQQQTEQNPNRSKAYLGSYQCTLDAFIQATKMVQKKPDWDWDRVVESMVNFWLKNEHNIRYWQDKLESTDRENLIIGRVVNFDRLRTELEYLF
jgi:hypothetical protein